jgi:CRISPR-associated endonuclease/helicase Cas3
MDREYYAHSLPDKPIEEWQRLEDHLKNVAEMAKGFADAFGAGEWGYLAGLWHDLGKCSSPVKKCSIPSTKRTVRVV